MKRITAVIIIALIFSIFAACGDSGTTYTPAPAPAPDADIYYGDSITFLCASHISGVNYAVGGHTSVDMLELISQHAPADNPSVYHILIGTNDVGTGIDGSLLKRLNEALLILNGPMYVMSILPTDNADKNAIIVSLNYQLRALTELHGQRFVDVYNMLTDDNGLLNPEYSDDGLHLNDAGCQQIFK